MNKINDFISFNPQRHTHSKASESYVEVTFKYESGKTFEGWIPVEYRRTGLDLKTEQEISDYLISIYPFLNPDKRKEWLAEQEKFWSSEKPNAGETKKVFDAISNGNWTCVNCSISNPNWARRFQDIKEFGYTFATNTPVKCPACGKRSTFLQAISIPRHHSVDGNGYETWSPLLRKRIISTLNNYDSYEGKVGSNLLPDHKFSEIRWDLNTKETNKDNMSQTEIKAKFQLMTNQRNQQKREVCRNCFQSGKRGNVFGIPFYYQGNENWAETISKTGKDAEKGCVGCPWYDLEKWRKELIKKING